MPKVQRSHVKLQDTSPYGRNTDTSNRSVASTSVAVISNPKTHICKDCGAQYLSSGGLSYHKTTKHVRKRYTCKECKEEFTSKQNMRQHQLTVHGCKDGSKVYVCPYENCGRAYVIKAFLDQHSRSHTNIRPYGCQVPGCGSMHKLFHHLKIHCKKIHEIDSGTQQEYLKKYPLPAEIAEPITATESNCSNENNDTIDNHDTTNYWVRPGASCEHKVSQTETSVTTPIHEATSVTSEPITATESNSSNENNDTIDRLQNSLSNEDILQEGDSISDTELYSWLDELIKTDPIFIDQLMSSLPK